MKIDVVFLLNAALASLLVYFLIETPQLKIFYTLTFFFFAYFFQCYLLGPEKTRITNRPHISLGRLIPYILGITSLFVLLPAVPRYNITVPWLAFASLTPLSVIRVISGYFLLSVFPGYVVYEVFLKNKHLVILEKVGFVLATSYAISIILGLSIRFLGLELSASSLVIAIWSFTLLVKAIEHILLKRKNRRVEAIPHTLLDHKQQPLSSIQLKYNQFEIALLAVTFLCLLFSSYFIVIHNEPTDFALTGDVARYVDVAKKFMLSQPLDLSYQSYIWFQIYMAEASILTGLHPMYAYVGLQYLIIIMPIAVYALVRTLCPQNKKAPIVALILTSILSGLGAIGLYDFYSTYKIGYALNPWYSSEVWEALNGVSRKLGLGGLHMLLASTIDYAMSMFAVTYGYKYLVDRKKNNIHHLLLCSFFFSIAVFSHNIFSTLFFTTTLFLYSTVIRKLKRFTILMLTTLILFISFDLLSGCFFSNQFFNQFYSYYLHATVFFLRERFIFQSVFIIEAPLIGITVCLMIYVIVAILRKKASNLTSFKFNFFNRPSARVTFWVLSFVIFIGAVYAWRVNHHQLDLFKAYSDPLYVFPWFIFVLRSYGFPLLLTLGFIPFFVTKHDRRDVLFLLSWIVSMLFLGFVGLMLPVLLTPSLWTNRYFGLMSLPLAFLAAIGLSSIRPQALNAKSNVKLTKKLSILINRKASRTIVSSLLILGFSISFLSHAYTIELFYSGSYGYGSLSPFEADAYEWIYYNLPTNSVILTYSYDPSYMRLASLTGRMVYSYQKFYSGGIPSWTFQLMSNSTSPEVLLYFLNKLGISHVFFSSYDTYLMRESLKDLLSLVSAFPVLYANEKVTLYTVPNLPNNEDDYLSYPEDLFKLQNPNLLNIYNLKGLHGYLFGYQDISIEGSSTIDSDYILFETTNVSIEKINIIDDTGPITFENVILNDLAINGDINVTIETANATIYNNPTNVLTEVSVTTPMEIRLDLKKGEVFFTIEENGMLDSFNLTQGSITIISPNGFGPLRLRLKHPTIALNGRLQTKWQGSFWHEDLLYTTVALPQEFPIEGLFTIQILYCSGTILAKIDDIQDVIVPVPPG